MQTQLIEFAKEQQTRVAERLKDADPLSAEYKIGLENLHSLCWLKNDLAMAPPAGQPCPAPEVSPEPVDTTEKDVEPEQEDPEEEHPHYTKEYVRQNLADARVKNGIDLTVIFDRMCYPSLSAVPEDKYWLVMSELGVELAKKQEAG